VGDVLIYADSMRSPELRHEVPVAVADPFLYVERDGRRIGGGRPGPVFRRMYQLYQEFKQKVMRAGKREAVSA